MAEFKEVVEKANRICDEFIGCSADCPLHKFAMFCPTDNINEVNELEYAIMNYKLEGEENDKSL